MTSSQLLDHIDFAASNSFGLFAGLISAYGLIRYSREIKHLGDSISRNFYLAGVIFVLYGIFTSAFFCEFTKDVLGVQSELFRGISAVFITYLIIKGLNIFDIETRVRIVEQGRHLAQSEKLTSLGQLAAGIAHEMNNPLTNASLGIQLLKKKLGSNGEEGVLDRLNAVEKNIDHAAMIAQELLQFSRNRELDLIPLDINELIRSTLPLMKFKLNNIDIEQSLAQVPHVMGDSIRLQQVIINVLSNAVEAMPAGGKISISTSAQGNGKVEVRIADTGIGITKDNMSRIFEPFYTTKEVGNGAGLGLSISYGIIKQHHGDIKITSTAGLGSTVTIEIPEV
jgi:signal transduction histidine kinase